MLDDRLERLNSEMSSAIAINLSGQCLKRNRDSFDDESRIDYTALAVSPK